MRETVEISNPATLPVPCSHCLSDVTNGVFQEASCFHIISTDMNFWKRFHLLTKEFLSCEHYMRWLAVRVQVRMTMRDMANRLSRLRWHAGPSKWLAGKGTDLEAPNSRVIFITKRQKSCQFLTY